MRFLKLFSSAMIALHMLGCTTAGPLAQYDYIRSGMHISEIEKRHGPIPRQSGPRLYINGEYSDTYVELYPHDFRELAVMELRLNKSNHIIDIHRVE